MRRHEKPKVSATNSNANSSNPSALELRLLRGLRDSPKDHSFRYTEQAHNHLLETLFLSLAGNDRGYFHKYFFPEDAPQQGPAAWKLSEAQGAVEGAEYSPAARGTACGHIFKAGEAAYKCKYVFSVPDRWLEAYHANLSD